MKTIWLTTLIWLTLSVLGAHAHAWFVIYEIEVNGRLIRVVGVVESGDRDVLGRLGDPGWMSDDCIVDWFSK